MKPEAYPAEMLSKYRKLTESGSAPATTTLSLYIGTLKAVEPAFTLIASFACSPSGNFLECIFRQQPDPTHIFLRRCGYGNQCTLKKNRHKRAS